jgi:hypothetical protein
MGNVLDLPEDYLQYLRILEEELIKWENEQSKKVGVK